jgi:O-antigen/teichoic acid export membrane protein
MIDRLAGKPSEKRTSETADNSIPVARSFVNPSILLFLDQFLIGVGGWVYWLAIPRFTTAAQIGEATTVYSLTIVITTLIQLGFEYPLLKHAQDDRSRIFGTALGIELAITIATVPLILYLMIGYGFTMDLVWLALGLIIVGPLGFVSRFALLGMSNARTVLLYDILGIMVKFATGIILVGAGYGAVGILSSFVLGTAITSIGTLLYSTKHFNFRFGNALFAKDVLRDSVINIPSKLSRMFVLSMSVLLLASFGISKAETGIFYVAVMISIAVAGFASSMAFMAIPASSKSKIDFSAGSLRLGLSYTAPVVVVLIVAPSAVLSIIGSEYVAASTTLVILSAGVLPSVVVSNLVSKLNTAKKYRQLMAIGTTQLATFVILFFILVPSLGPEGASYSITISFVIAALIGFVWLDKTSRKHVLVAVLSIACSSLAAILVQNALNLHAIATIVVGVIICLSILFKLGNTSVRETKHLIHILREK